MRCVQADNDQASFEMGSLRFSGAPCSNHKQTGTVEVIRSIGTTVREGQETAQTSHQVPVDGSSLSRTS